MCECEKCNTPEFKNADSKTRKKCMEIRKLLDSIKEDSLKQFMGMKIIQSVAVDSTPSIIGALELLSTSLGVMDELVSEQVMKEMLPDMKIMMNEMDKNYEQN